MWTLIKRIEEKLDGNRPRKLPVILNSIKKQHPTKQQLYDHLPPISKSFQIRQTWHIGHDRRSKDELISDVRQKTPLHGHTRVGWPARAYLQELCTDTECRLEDLPETIDEWWERVKEISTCSTTIWYIYIYMYMYVCIRKYIYLSIYLSIYEYIYIYIYICIYVCICIFEYVLEHENLITKRWGIIFILFLKNENLIIGTFPFDAFPNITPEVFSISVLKR